MVHEIAIEVELDTLENATQVTGQIHFLVDYYRYFPEQEWSDFVVIVLCWWIKSFKGLLMSKPGMVYEFDFMDGTPIVFAKKIDSHHIELFFCESNMANVEYSATCSIHQLRDSLMATSQKVVRAITRNKWTSKEMDELINLTLSLERYPL